MLMNVTNDIKQIKIYCNTNEFTHNFLNYCFCYLILLLYYVHCLRVMLGGFNGFSAKCRHCFNVSVASKIFTKGGRTNYSQMIYYEAQRKWVKSEGYTREIKT